MMKKNIMENSEKNIIMGIKKLPLDIEYMIYDFIPRPTEHIRELERARWHVEDKWTKEQWGTSNPEYDKFKYGIYIRSYIGRIQFFDGEIMPYMMETEYGKTYRR